MSTTKPNEAHTKLADFVETLSNENSDMIYVALSADENTIGRSVYSSEGAHKVVNLMLSETLKTLRDVSSSHNEAILRGALLMLNQVDLEEDTIQTRLLAEIARLLTESPNAKMLVTDGDSQSESPTIQ